jgi:hypothetical protein
MIVIIGDKDQPYTQFMAEAVDELSKYAVQGLALVALIDDHYDLTAYWNMDLRQKLQAESALRFDVLDTFLKANPGRYCGEGEEDATD